MLSAATVALLLPAQIFAASALSVTQEAIATGSVPKGAQRVPFLELTFAAPCGSDATVRQVTLVHDGLGESSDINRVYATDGRKRLSRSRTIQDSDHTVVIRFAPLLTVKACSSRTVTIVADISADASPSGEHRLSVELPSDIVADGFEVKLSAAPTKPTAVVRPKAIGTVSVTIEGANTPLRYGADRTLARIRLEADGEADQEISSILLTNAGKATDGDLKNLRIQSRRGEVLTNVAATMDGDAVRLTFDPPFSLDRNDEVLLELKGDIRASNRRTIRFVLEEPSDLEAAPRGR